MATDMRSLGEPPPAGEAFAPADGLLHDLTVLLVAVTASRPVHVGLDLDRAMAGLRLADVLEPAGARRLWLPSGRLLGEGDEVRPLVDWRERLRVRIHRPDLNYRGARWSVVVQGRPAMWPLDADREGDLIFYAAGVATPARRAAPRRVRLDRPPPGRRTLGRARRLVAR